MKYSWFQKDGGLPSLKKVLGESSTFEVICQEF